MPHKLNTDRADEIQQELEQGDRTSWTPADGRNEIRIMPPWDEEMADEGKYFFLTGFHYRIGPDERTLPCPRMAGIREDCYLCSLANRLKKSSDDDDQAEAKELWAKRKYLMNVVDLNHPERGIQVWSAGIKAMKGVHFYVRDRDYGDITDLEEGYDLIVEKSGEKLNTEYLVRAKKNSSKFPSKAILQANPQLEEDLADLRDLRTFLTYPSNGEMKDAYEGTTGREERRRDDDDDEDDKPRGRSSRRRDADEDDKPSGKESRAGDKAEDGDDEDEGDKPRSSSSRSASRSKGPRFPDEDKKGKDDDEEEEDEDKEPARRSGSASTARRVSKALRSRSRER